MYPDHNLLFFALGIVHAEIPERQFLLCLRCDVTVVVFVAELNYSPLVSVLKIMSERTSGRCIYIHLKQKICVCSCYFLADALIFHQGVIHR